MKKQMESERGGEALTKVSRSLSRKRAKSPRGTLILASVVLLIFSLFRPACVERLGDLPLLIFSSLDGKGAATEITIAAIDDRSIEEMGSWPWPRATFLGFLEKLRQMNAGLIVIDANVASDMGISELRLPIRRDGGPDYVVGYTFYPTLAALPAGTATEAMERELKDAAEKLAFPSTPSDESPIPAMAGIRINRFSPADRLYLSEGFGNIFPDADGGVRSQPLAARLRHRAYPALSLAAAARWLSFTPILAQDPKGKPSGVIMGKERISTKADSRLAIRYRGGAGSFEQISASEIFSGKVGPESIEGRMILVGLCSHMLKASHKTPFGEMPDVEIIANSIDNILSNRGLISHVGRLSSSLAFLAVALIYILLILRLSPKPQAAATITIVIGLIAAGVAGIYLKGVILPVAYPAAGAVLLYLTMTAWRLIRHEAPIFILKKCWRGRIRSGDIEVIAANPSALTGAARAVSVTALAADIKGFGSIVEQLAPSNLAEFVKDYRGLVATCCMEQGGFIEAFSGDECTAVFGAPLKRADHAMAAIAAAAKLRRQLFGMREEFESRFGIGKIRIGIGIHTGVAAAGDTGAGGPGFGMVGAALEAAAQLRALNRIYRTATLVGDMTRASTEAGYSYRPLDPVKLRGEGGVVMIHEFVGEFGTIMPQLNPFIEARDAYMRGDFRAAARLFSSILESHPHDGPSQLFMRRAIHLTENPPEQPWTGVWVR